MAFDQQLKLIRWIDWLIISSSAKAMLPPERASIHHPLPGRQQAGWPNTSSWKKTCSNLANSCQPTNTLTLSFCVVQCWLSFLFLHGDFSSSRVMNRCSKSAHIGVWWNCRAEFSSDDDFVSQFDLDILRLLDLSRKPDSSINRAPRTTQLSQIHSKPSPAPVTPSHMTFLTRLDGPLVNPFPSHVL